MSTCRRCDIELTSENWSKGNQRCGNYICIKCKSTYAKQRYRKPKVRAKEIERAKQWRKEHPNSPFKRSKEYMTKYMRDYRKKHRSRIDEIARLTYHRRDRELSTDTILNKHFEGANLHHMTPSVAVYIPQTLHRSVFHNLKTEEAILKMMSEEESAKMWRSHGELRNVICQACGQPLGKHQVKKDGSVLVGWDCPKNPFNGDPSQAL